MKKQQALEDRQGQLQQEMQIYGQELNQPIGCLVPGVLIITH